MEDQEDILLVLADAYNKTGIKLANDSENASGSLEAAFVALAGFCAGMAGNLIRHLEKSREVELTGELEDSVKAGDLDNEYGGQDADANVSPEAESEGDSEAGADDGVDTSPSTPAS